MERSWRSWPLHRATFNETIYREAQRAWSSVQRGGRSGILRLLLSRRGAARRSSDCGLDQRTEPISSTKNRQQLERQFGPGYARWVAELGATRKLVLASDLDPQRKRELLHSLASREALEVALAEESAVNTSEDTAGNNRRVTA